MKSMTRNQLLAAEIFSYSFDNYANHLGIGHVRFENYMPDNARDLERAHREGWSDERLAKALDLPLERVPEFRKRYQDALEVVDASSPAEAFRAGVRQSLLTVLKHRNLLDAEIEDAVKQICYRAADLSFLLATRNETLAKYSQELRREG
jgi:hypothetical protein